MNILQTVLLLQVLLIVTGSTYFAVKKRFSIEAVIVLCCAENIVIPIITALFSMNAIFGYFVVSESIHEIDILLYLPVFVMGQLLILGVFDRIKYHDIFAMIIIDVQCFTVFSIFFFAHSRTNLLVIALLTILLLVIVLLTLKYRMFLDRIAVKKRYRFLRNYKKELQSKYQKQLRSVANEHLKNCLVSMLAIESINRPAAVRVFERFIASISPAREYTTGIMQVRSKKILSDKESIELAVSSCSLTWEHAIGSAGDRARAVAQQYNGSSRYADMVIEIMNIV